MTDRDALIAAIHAVPDDDAPRLVFADWLDEHGEHERAEFLRIQIRMWREYEKHGRPTPRLDAMFLEQKALFKKPWADVLRRCGAGAISTYSRGYATAPFHMAAATFVAEAPELAGWFGPAAKVVLYDCGGALADVARTAGLRWVHTLELTAGWNGTGYADDDLDALCRSPHLGSLRELVLSSGSGQAAVRLSARACMALAGAESLTGLRSLTLVGHPVGNAGVAALAGSPRLATLRVLRLGDVGLSARGVRALIGSPHLRGLERLVLSPRGLNTRLLNRLADRFGPAVQFESARTGP